MNDLTSLYESIKTFADGHSMVNQFILVGSEDELNQREFDYRTLVMLAMEANLSRELNSPIYTLDFGIFVLDRIFVDDSLAHMSSVQENIHILGQLQDYLLQQNLDVNFQEVELTSSLADDYNITIAMSDFSISLARNPYIRTIDA
tara:strand:- start:6 stop:443 length:438 start_codon:yes stop_codon:yes gene_type:complete